MKDNILVTRADKGNSTVIVYKEEYFSCMTNMFSDEILYRVVSKDPTMTTESKYNKLIDHLYSIEAVNKLQALNMKKHNSVCPKTYGLSKTHNGYK